VLLRSRVLLPPWGRRDAGRPRRGIRRPFAARTGVGVRAEVGGILPSGPTLARSPAPVRPEGRSVARPRHPFHPSQPRASTQPRTGVGLRAEVGRTAPPPSYARAFSYPRARVAGGWTSARSRGCAVACGWNDGCRGRPRSASPPHTPTDQLPRASTQPPTGVGLRAEGGSIAPAPSYAGAFSYPGEADRARQTRVRGTSARALGCSR
jgi:hypothetical protein